MKISPGKNMMDDLLKVIEEQADIIMQQADRISRLSRLLIEHYEVDKAELESIIRPGKGEKE